MRTLSAPVLLVTLLCLLTLVGCSRPATPGTPLRVVDAWARPSAVAAAAHDHAGHGSSARTAAYLVIRNDSPTADRLTAARTDVAGSVELHESYLEGSVMRMRPVPFIEVPAGGSVALQPGGYHLMLLDLHQPARAGERFSVTLVFERAAEVVVEVTVREP